ncbi:MAG: TIGR01457 family HAD-type hydrolase [Streptococcaceae bacterium]|jgi:4-nitrophenyl phosphatase|nr:TIGR01457 family HAD-type hydrolase [Streptococcaceae bacterium]
MLKHKDYKGYIIDLDGTIYLGEGRIPAGEDFIHRLQAAGIPYLFVTNNTTRRPEVVAERLATKFNINTSVASIYTASRATADYMDELGLEKTVYIIGGDGLKSEILGRGYVENRENPAYVVVAVDMELTYEKLKTATFAIQRGAKFIGTNPDLNLPTSDGLLPGSGSIVACVKASTQVEPTFIGKPEAIITDLVVHQMGLDKSDLLVVGDNYLTDIRTGIDNGIDTLLVTTGFTKPEEVATLPDAPTYVVSSLEEWEF